MRLFIFKPHEEWKHCGGAKIAVAASFERAAELLASDDEGHLFVKTNEDLTREEREKMDSRLQIVFEVWVLAAEFEISEEDEKIVLSDYQWA